MEKLVNVTIEHDKVRGSFQSTTNNYVFKVNNIVFDFCNLDLNSKVVVLDYVDRFLEFLNIEKGNYTSYKNKFQEFGVILEEEKDRTEVLERFKVFSTLKEGIYNVMYFFEDNKADLLQIDILNEKVIYHFLDQHLNNLGIKNKNFKAYINKFKEIGLNIEEEAVYED